MPSSREMTFHEAPAARRVANWGMTATGGSLVPWAFVGLIRKIALNPLSVSALACSRQSRINGRIVSDRGWIRTPGPLLSKQVRSLMEVCWN
jgi:hypothetical protein